MCWYVEFQVRLLNNKDNTVKEIEELISDFRIKVGKKGIDEVTFVKGSIADGYRTTLHCDCDNINEKKSDEFDGIQLLHYPELFEIIIERPAVKNIQAHWYWSKDEPKIKEQKMTITEFIEQNQNFKLSSKFSYRIIKEKYY